MPGSRLARLWEWLRDAPTLAGLWLLDRIAGQYPEREADRIRERRRARLQRAFPGVDIDGTGGQAILLKLGVGTTHASGTMALETPLARAAGDHSQHCDLGKR